VRKDQMLHIMCIHIILELYVTHSCSL
jgi:hypothetical protein